MWWFDGKQQERLIVERLWGFPGIKNTGVQADMVIENKRLKDHKNAVGWK